ncbi:MAG: hypothetical protein VX000_12350, partial [Myxococcota bacterium]|nr:hypothetical protein [Myxococcota bacterium]
MKEEGEEGRAVADRTRRMRPSPAGNRWSLTVAAAAVAGLLGLGAWAGLSPLQRRLLAPSDHEAVHAVGARMAARWPQAPGPPERYVAEAVAAIRAGSPALAARKLGMALALDPDQAEALLRLAMLDARGDGAGLLLPGEADELVAAVRKVSPDAPLLGPASAWQSLAAGRPESVAPGLGPLAEGEPPEGLWARLRAARALEQPEGRAARALLATWPGHPEACEDGPREALRQGALAEAERLAGACEAGPARAVARRVKADVLARTGRLDRARRAYTEAGLLPHAAAVALRAGLPLTDAESAALAGPGTPLAMHQAWAAMAAGDGSLLRIALERIPDAPAPELAVTRAAAWLWLGYSQAASEALEGVSGTHADILRGAMGPDQTNGDASPDGRPHLPGGLDPVGMALMLGPAVTAVPTHLVWKAARAPGEALVGVQGWTPTDPRAAALVAWVEAPPGAGTPLPVPAGEDPLDAALAVARAIDSGAGTEGLLARLRGLAPQAVMTAVL